VKEKEYSKTECEEKARRIAAEGFGYSSRSSESGRKYERVAEFPSLSKPATTKKKQKQREL
jgi:hypothetical protein